MTLLARRYAGALFVLAAQQEATDVVAADLEALRDLVAEPIVAQFLASPELRGEQRARVLQRLGEGRHQLVRNLIGVLQQRRRLAVLGDLHAAFRALAMQARGEVDAIVESAHPLGTGELGAVHALARRLSGRAVQLTAVQRPELLGGVRLLIGNVLYDGSLRAALDQLEQQLLQTSM